LPEGSDNVFVYWNEMDPDQNLRGIYGQKFSATGERLWTDNGKTFIDISSQNVYPLAARNTATDMVVFYEDYFDAMSGKIKAMRIDTDGGYVWEPTMIDMCTVQSSKVHTEVGDLHDDQWIAVWEDDRSGTSDIYGQNIHTDGSLGSGTITYDLDVYPDSLFFDTLQNAIDGEYFTAKNNSPVPLTIMNIPLENYLPGGWGWYISNFTGSFPYTLEPGDSLNLLVKITFPTDAPILFDYVYDNIQVEMEVQAYAVTICLNSDLIESVNENLTLSEVVCSPNPFSSEISLSFSLPEVEQVKITIYNAFGEVVMEPVFGTKFSAGKNNVKLNSEALKPGVYMLDLSAGASWETIKMIKTR
jgi:hypothetical protein